MPLIEVKAFDHRIDDATSRAIITALTDALCATVGEEVRAETWVVVEGISPQRWGIGGEVRG